jgi:tripartite-type tricarboxylate transporter receptor subunit TctC
MKFLLRVSLSIVLGACGLYAAGTAAQAYPTKPVHIIVPFAPGGGADTTARAFAQKYTEVWKQQVVIDNRGGAGGIIGADAVAKSAPDGYTLLFNTNGQAISPALYRKLPFDPVRDFAPVTQLTGSSQVLVTSPKLPAATVKELIALAKAQPGKLNFGSSGVGGAGHLAGELFKARAGIDMVYVPYKADSQTIPALFAGDVQMSFIPLSAVYEHIKSGRLRALGVTGLKRAPPIPTVPTMIEAGVPDYDFSGWLALFAPAGTPQNILARISADAARIVNMPDMNERLLAWGLDPAGTTPEEFAVRYKADLGMYAKLIKVAGIPQQD